MKVLLANKFFFLNGGSETVFFGERDYLMRRGIAVLDFAMEHPSNLHSEHSAFFAHRREYTGGNLWNRLTASAAFIHSRHAVHQFSLLLDREAPDLVHCHNIYHQLTPSIIGAAKKKGIPVVLTLHDYKTVCPTYVCLNDGRVCTQCVDEGVHRVLINRCAEKSTVKSGLLYAEATFHAFRGSYDLVDLFLAPSTFMSELVTRKRFPQEKVRVLHNGIDAESIVPSKLDQGYILFLGRLAKEKGIEVLLRTHSALVPGAPLLIAGDGPLRRELQERFPFAQFLGQLSGERLSEIVRNAAVVVVPSEWYENCPMAVLEAMAFARPVVASRIGGIPEMVIDDETGVLFPPGDQRSLHEALTRLITNPSLRRTMGEAGRRRVEEHFSVRNHNEALLATYSELVAAQRSKWI